MSGNRTAFRNIAAAIERAGVADLLEWLDQTDFYEAPASSRFHGSVPEGLVMHSINVYRHLKRLNEVFDAGYSEESIAIVALFHDLCKVNFYKRDWKNQKTYDPVKVKSASVYSVKHDNNGDFIWESVPFYRTEEQYHFGGHGSKSVYLVMNFMKLTPEEAAAINSHMGPWDRQDYGKPGDVFSDNLLAWMLHVADEAATYINES